MIAQHQTRRVPPLILIAMAILATAAHAQQASMPADDLTEGLRLLEGVRDNVFSFDDPAFYWFCRHVQQEGDPSLFHIRADEAPVSWRFLLERPSDYRGRLVVVEGILQAVHAYEVTNRSGIGTLYQCELSEVGTRAFCTVVVTANPNEAPLRSRVRAKGYFIKVRAFQTTGGEAGAGPLLVAEALELVQPPTRSMWNDTAGGGWWSPRKATFWLLPGTAALAVLWLILRRRVRGTSGNARQRSVGTVSHDAPESNGDFEWLTKDSDDQGGAAQ